jgi:hypothetical protein
VRGGPAQGWVGGEDELVEVLVIEGGLVVEGGGGSGRGGRVAVQLGREPVDRWSVRRWVWRVGEGGAVG